jgi:hypothetical protein
VLAGGVFAAIIGPQTVIFTRELFAPVMFAGSFVALVPLALITMSILWFLRIPNDTKPGDAGHDETPARPLLEIISQSRFITAMICGVGSYALMTFMMTGAPLAMVGCGFSPELATLGIQWHVMAMFAPSFFTGKLIARFGRDTITATGLVILLGCAIVASYGHRAVELLAGSGASRRRLEFRLHRRHHHGDHDLPAVGEEQGAGFSRCHPVRHRCLFVADVGQGAQRLGLGCAQQPCSGRWRLFCLWRLRRRTCWERRRRCELVSGVIPRQIS